MRVRGIMSAWRQAPSPDVRLSGRASLLLIFFVALVVRAAYFFAYLRSPLFGVYRIDQLYYRTWGLEIAAGEWIGTKAFEQSPLYAYLLGAFYRLFGPQDTVILMLQLIAGTATVLLVTLSARRVFGRNEGLAAGAIAAVYSPFLFYDCALMKTFLEPLFVLAAFVAALRAEESRSLRWPAAAGAAIGLACLVREVHLLLLPPLLAAIWFEQGGKSTRRLAATAALLATFVGTLTPAAVHNRLAGGEFVGVSAAGGENLYIGFGPYATGFYAIPDFLGPYPYLEHQDFRDEAFLRTRRPHSQAASSRYWFGETWRHVREAPGATVGLLARKAAILFSDFEVPDSENFTATRDFIPLLTALPSFGWITGLGLLGLCLAATQPRRHLLLLGFAAALLLEILVTFNLGRYRAAFAALWLVLAGHGAVWLWAALVRPRGWPVPGLVAAAGVGIATFLFFQPPFGIDVVQQQRELVRFRREAAKNVTVRDTIPELRRTLSLEPGAPTRLFELGTALELTGRLPEAAHYYQETIRAAPDLPGPRVRLADLLLRQNRPESALPHVRALTVISPDDEYAYLALGRIGLLEASNAPDQATALLALAKAIVALRNAARLEPRDFSAHLNLARAYHLVGDAAAARQELRASFDLDPESRQWHSLARTILPP